MDRDNEIKTLENLSREYTSPNPARRMDQKMVRFIAKLVVDRLKDGNVLEMGVGDRIWTPLVLKRFGKTTVVDASSDLLNSLDEFSNLGEIEKRCSLFEEFSPDTPFDNILCTYVLEHVEDPVQLLRRVAAWLKPKGEIHLIIPHALSLHRRLAVIMKLQKHVGELGDSDRQVAHRRCLSYCELDRIVAEAGLTAVERTGLATKLVPNALMENYPDELLRGLVLLGVELPIEYSGALYYRITA